MEKRPWSLYRWGTDYAGIEIMIPVKCEEASTSSKGHPLHALARKTLTAFLQEVLESVIKIVNYVKTSNN